MGVSLKKSQRVSLTKEAPGSKGYMIGLGWDPIDKQSVGRTVEKEVRTGLFGKKKVITVYETEPGLNHDIDCDAAIDMRGTTSGARETIYFGNKTSRDGSIKHMGDNLTGDGDGDDEQIFVDTNRVDSKYDELVVGVNIYSAASRQQRFGLVKNAFIRVVDIATGREICRYDLSGTAYDKCTAMIMGVIYRTAEGWDFEAAGEGHVAKNIEDMFNKFR